MSLSYALQLRRAMGTRGERSTGHWQWAVGTPRHWPGTSWALASDIMGTATLATTDEQRSAADSCSLNDL